MPELQHDLIVQNSDLNQELIIRASSLTILCQVSSEEAEFLQQILPDLYKNLLENPQTLLTKYYGMFAYQVLIQMFFDVF